MGRYGQYDLDDIDGGDAAAFTGLAVNVGAGVSVEAIVDGPFAAKSAYKGIPPLPFSITRE